MAIYLLVAVVMLVAAFLWLGDYGDCKPDSSFFSRGFRIWSMSLIISLIYFFYESNYGHNDEFFISGELCLFLCLATFIWFIILGLISNYYIVFMIEIVLFVCSIFDVGKTIRGIDFPLFFAYTAGIGLVAVYIFPQASMRGELEILSKNRSNSVLARFLDGYRETHGMHAILFRRLRRKCAIRLGFYRINADRFNAYYADELRGRFEGSGIFLNELDSWMHDELPNNNFIIQKYSLFNPKDIVDSAIIFSCLRIMKYSEYIFYLVEAKDRRGREYYAHNALFAMSLFDETIETMKKKNTIAEDDAEKLWKEFYNIKEMRLKENRA